MEKPNYRTRPTYVHATQASFPQYIETPSGTSRVNKGDWVVESAADRYVLTDQLFKRAFEPVPEQAC
jgi:hypothetical protein